MNIIVIILYLCTILTCVKCLLDEEYELLKEILGPAFNPRYMSIEKPEEQKTSTGKKRFTYTLDFYLEPGYEEDLEQQPAWRLTNHVDAAVSMGNMRYRRTPDLLQEWQCKSEIKWTDLGMDYFPRYLRSVECLTNNCWFNMYKCKPRSFTMKLLKKRSSYKPNSLTVGVPGLSTELRKMWLWEERTVNFCCDCSL